jgi:hypothetical protein
MKLEKKKKQKKKPQEFEKEMKNYKSYVKNIPIPNV